MNYGVIRSPLVFQQEGWGLTPNFAIASNWDLNFNPTDDSCFYGLKCNYSPVPNVH